MFFVLECSIKQGDKDTDMYSSAVKKKKNQRERQTQMQTNTRRGTKHMESLEVKKRVIVICVVRTGRSFVFKIQTDRLTHIGSITTVFVRYACLRTKIGSTIRLRLPNSLSNSSLCVFATYLRTRDKPYMGNTVKSCATVFPIRQSLLFWTRDHLSFGNRYRTNAVSLYVIQMWPTTTTRDYTLELLASPLHSFLTQ